MAPIAFRWARFSLLSCLPREKTTDTHYSPFLGSPEMSDKLRYEWHCWADARTNDGNARTNDSRAVQTILLHYCIWNLNVCLCPCPAQTLNNTFGAKNSSTFSTAPDDPSSISTKVLCIFAHTIIPTSLLILLLYNAPFALLSNTTTTTTTTEKRILI